MARRVSTPKSALPQTIVSSSDPANIASSGTGTTRAMPDTDRTAAIRDLQVELLQSERPRACRVELTVCLGHRGLAQHPVEGRAIRGRDGGLERHLVQLRGVAGVQALTVLTVLTALTVLTVLTVLTSNSSTPAMLRSTTHSIRLMRGGGRWGTWCVC